MKIITLEEAKQYLKIDDEFTDDDALVNSLIDAVGDYIDEYLQRNLQRKPKTLEVEKYVKGVLPSYYPRITNLYQIKLRDHVPDVDDLTIKEIQEDQSEKAIAVNPKVRISDTSGYIFWQPADDVEISCPDQLIASIIPQGDQKVPEGIKQAAKVLIHSLFSYRTTIIGEAQNNLADKFLQVYRNYI